MAGNIHYWGISTKDEGAFKKKHPSLNIIFDREGVDHKIRIGALKGYAVTTLRNFTSDCGAVQLAGAYAATQEILDAIKDYCSCSGYSVVITTLVSETAEDKAKLFVRNGYKVVDSGYSNRNDVKQHLVLILRISDDDMVKKGY